MVAILRGSDKWERNLAWAKLLRLLPLILDHIWFSTLLSETIGLRILIMYLISVVVKALTTPES